jgi:hypothetical protein
VISGSEAVRNTHAWFEQHSGWAPPGADTLEEWVADGLCRCPDECLVAVAEPCQHGLASWWLVLRALDRPASKDPMEPGRLVPHPDRLDPARADYVAVIEAHHSAIEAGDVGYLDPATGLFVQTARTLWQRGSCCDQGCRHCPYVERGQR